MPLLSGARPATAPSPGKSSIAYFSFDSGATDHSRGGATAELANAPITDKSLHLNGIYGMGNDGKSYKATFNVSKLDYHQFTVAWRFKANDFDSHGFFYHDNLLAGGKDYRWMTVTRLDNGRLRVELNNDELRHEFNDTDIRAGVWNTVACAVDLAAKRISVRVNEAQASTFSLPANFKLNVIGADAEDKDRLFTFTNYFDGCTFSGEISDLIVFPYALSADDLNSLHAIPDPSNSDGR